MKNLLSYLLVIFMIMFWGFRIMVAINASLDKEFIVTPFDFTFEIALLFVTLFCIVLVVRRNMIGAILYVFSHALYFGVDLFNIVWPVFQGEAQLQVTQLFQMLISAIGIFLPVFVLMELAFDKNSKNHPKDKKTDWFYKNEEYDRQLDERADKNNYRTL